MGRGTALLAGLLYPVRAALTCIHHEEGHRKILSFHGKGTVFPVYHGNRFKIERSIATQALEDMEALEFSPPQFRRMMEESFPLTETVIDWYASYVNLLLYETRTRSTTAPS